MTRSTRRFALPAFTLAALLAPTAPAAAQPPKSPEPAQVNQHYEAGLKAAKRSQWLQARESFLKAWRLRAHYQIAANLGRAELMTGAYRDAAEHLAYFLREAPAEVSAQDRAQAQQWLDEAKAKIGTIALAVEPAGAEVLLDGVRLPSPLPAEVYVEPGRRVVEVRRRGHLDARRELDLSAGQREEVEIRLDAEPPAAAPPPPGPPEPARSRALIGIGIGASVAAAAGGAAMMVVAAVKAGRQGDLCAERGVASCAPRTEIEWTSLERSRIDALNVGITSFIGAGVIGAATAVYALTGGGTEAPARAGRVRVHVAPGGVGVSGHF